MDNIGIIGLTSLAVAGLTIAIGTMAPAMAQAKSITQALASIAQQPDEAGTISRTLFVGLAMIESLAIYCFVISIIVIFVNPFWNVASGG
jgi:F-type H+-transporting ATPase subunit c